jgi:hypothetical protein
MGSDFIVVVEEGQRVLANGVAIVQLEPLAGKIEPFLLKISGGGEFARLVSRWT